MRNSNDLLDHLEKIHDEYEVLVDKIPTEDKLIMAFEEERSVVLEPWEIAEVVQSSLNNLPEGLENYVDSLFDVVYDAVSEALERARR